MMEKEIKNSCPRFVETRTRLRADVVAVLERIWNNVLKRNLQPCVKLPQFNLVMHVQQETMAHIIDVLNIYHGKLPTTYREYLAKFYGLIT